MKNVIFTTFFVILLQESHQNLMWKIVISSNLNSLLKLYFYSPILANNNMLLKIYCENIVIEFLNCHFFFFLYIIFPFFLSFYHPYIFFFLLIFLHHTRIPIYPYPLPFFSFTFHFPEPSSLFLSPALFLNSFFFFFLIFLLDSNTLSNFLCNKKRRKNRWVRWLRFAVPSAPLSVPPCLPLCRRRSSSTLSPLVVLPTTRLGQIGLLFLSFFFSFFFSFFRSCLF